MNNRLIILVIPIILFSINSTVPTLTAAKDDDSIVKKITNKVVNEVKPIPVVNEVVTTITEQLPPESTPTNSPANPIQPVPTRKPSPTDQNNPIISPTQPVQQIPPVKVEITPSPGIPTISPPVIIENIPEPTSIPDPATGGYNNPSQPTSTPTQNDTSSPSESTSPSSENPTSENKNSNESIDNPPAPVSHVGTVGISPYNSAPPDLFTTNANKTTTFGLAELDSFLISTASENNISTYDYNNSVPQNINFALTAIGLNSIVLASIVSRSQDIVKATVSLLEMIR